MKWMNMMVATCNQRSLPVTSKVATCNPIRQKVLKINVFISPRPRPSPTGRGEGGVMDASA